MNLGWILLVLLIGLFLSAVYSGSETGFYSLNRSRVDLDASRGLRGARLVRRLSERRATILITILIGNNITVEMLTLVSEYAFAQSGGHGSWSERLFLTFGLTLIVFFFGELLPKDFYRRRPHELVRLSAPILLVSRIVFFPLERILWLLTWCIEKLLGFEAEVIVRRPGRMQVLGVLAESRAAGVLEPHAEELARNALKLRALPVTRAMIPWKEVVTIPAGETDQEQRKRVEASKHTRLPVLEESKVTGYVHQLRILQAGPAQPVLEHLRPLTFLQPDLSVDRALARLRVSGGRLAGVGTPEQPLGLVTLKDLVEEISGDLGGW